MHKLSSKLLPFCSVIVLNYNGKRLIKEVINSLRSLKYPSKRFEVIIVDNHSSDGSQGIIARHIKYLANFKLINSDVNGGFSAGNNLGIKQAKGEYIALLNNDCLVTPNWLTELVKQAETDPKIFSVNSKIYLYPQYIYLQLNCLGLLSATISDSKLFDYQLAKSQILRPIKLEDCLVLPVPFSPEDKSMKLTLKLGSHPSTKLSLTPFGSKVALFPKDISSNNFEIKLDLASLKRFKSDLIQNIGSMVFQDGYGRDIGASVIPGTQDYEIDNGQYDSASEVFTSCAASCLYRKSILDKIGSLDESFFMYYEDTELSWRARIFGYKNVTAPSSIARHFHSLSNIEWSPFFVSQVEYGRLRCLYYSAPSQVFFKELLKFIIKSFGQLGRFLFTGQTSNLINLKTSIRFLLNLPKSALNKYRKYSSHLDYQTKSAQVYSEILQGRWYRVNL